MGIKRFFTQEATIQRVVKTSDGAGYFKDEWQILMVVKGRLDMLSGSKNIMAHTELTKYSHVFLCEPFPILITPKDRIVIGNSIYDLIYVDNPVNMAHHYELLLNFNSLINVNSQESEKLAFHNLYTESVLEG